MNDTIHATTVAFGQQAVVILGASGSGKSSLGLALMSLGADLVADDRTCLHVHEDQLVATCPPALRGRIEARQVGILHAACTPSALVRLTVDLDRHEPNRLPEHHVITLSGIEVDCLYGKDVVNLPMAIKLMLAGGREL